MKTLLFLGAEFVAVGVDVSDGSPDREGPIRDCDDDRNELRGVISSPS